MILHNGTQILAKGHSRIVKGFLDAVCKSSRAASGLQHCPGRNVQVRNLSSLSSLRNPTPANTNGADFGRQPGHLGGNLELKSRLPHTRTEPNDTRLPCRSSHTDSTTQDTLTSDLRNLMRALPHSVVVITTSLPAAEARPQSPSKPRYQHKGMTLSSFTTLTLTPSPLVTFNIRDPSQTLAALAASRSFLIHVLRADHAGARVADAFTRGNAVNPFERLKVEKISSVGDLEEGGAQRKDMGNSNSVGEGTEAEAITLPKIEEDGVLRVIKCSLLEDDAGAQTGLFKIGDHVVVFGKVDALLPGFAGAEEVADQGLLYVNGAYHAGGEAISIEPLKRV